MSVTPLSMSPILNPCEGPAITIDCMGQKLANSPEPPRIFRGITQPSLGCVFGPSKSGKTTLVENLALTIASGVTTFFGDPVFCPNSRVLLLGLEEYPRSRTVRNQNQIKGYNEAFNPNRGWEENVFVMDESFHRYFTKEDHWTLLEKEIERIKPSLVMLDSLTRMVVESIEDSSVASKIMKRLREIAYKHGIALVLIHHSQKMDNRPVTIATLAGSRVVGQEMDFMIGVNRTSQNVRYVKDVAYRYWPDDSETVVKFSIDDYQMIHSLGEAYENDLLAAANSTSSMFDSDILVQKNIAEMTGNDESVLIKTNDLYERLVKTGTISKPTLHAALNRLEKSGVICKPEKGSYRLNIPS